MTPFFDGRRLAPDSQRIVWRRKLIRSAELATGTADATKEKIAWIRDVKRKSRLPP